MNNFTAHGVSLYLLSLLFLHSLTHSSFIHTASIMHPLCQELQPVLSAQQKTTNTLGAQESPASFKLTFLGESHCFTCIYFCPCPHMVHSPQLMVPLFLMLQPFSATSSPLSRCVLFACCNCLFLITLFNSKTFS